MKKVLRILCCLLAAFAVMFCALPASAAILGDAIIGPTYIISDIPEEESAMWFTAPESGFYKYSSTGNYDTVGYILDSYGNTLVYADDCADDMNFSIYCYMEKGQTYLLVADSYEEDTVFFGVKIENSNIESVDISNVAIYDGVNSITMFDYNDETGEFDIEYMYYSYNPPVTVTLKDGTVLQSDGDGGIEIDGQTYYCECEDDQGAENEWGIGEYTAKASIFGFSKNITVTVKENPIASVEFHDITLYDDWDCIVIDEEWEEILGIEIPEPIKVFYYVPQYTATFKDGTVLRSNEFGMVEYNGSVLMFEGPIDDQYFDNQWGVGEHTSEASFLGITGVFNVSVKPNPMQSVHFDDITLLKDWDYDYDYEYNPETDEYDLEWKHYYYIPSYTITLNDGTILKSDEIGSIKYDGKQYIFLNLDDGQSYATPFVEGANPVSVKIFGSDATFNVILEEMVSVSGDINRDEVINNKDLGLLMQYLNNWKVISDVGASDVNADGVVNNKDYGLFMQYLNGWEVEIGK